MLEKTLKANGKETEMIGVCHKYDSQESCARFNTGRKLKKVFWGRRQGFLNCFIHTRIICVSWVIIKQIFGKLFTLRLKVHCKNNNKQIHYYCLAHITWKCISI